MTIKYEQKIKKLLEQAEYARVKGLSEEAINRKVKSPPPGKGGDRREDSKGIISP